jgi:hypothetical protein
MSRIIQTMLLAVLPSQSKSPSSGLSQWSPSSELA